MHVNSNPLSYTRPFLRTAHSLRLKIIVSILLHHRSLCNSTLVLVLVASSCTTTSYGLYNIITSTGNPPFHAPPPSLHRLHRQPIASLHQYSPLRRPHPPQLASRNPCLSPVFKKSTSCQRSLLLWRSICLMAITQSHERQRQKCRLCLEIMAPHSALK